MRRSAKGMATAAVRGARRALLFGTGFFVVSGLLAGCKAEKSRTEIIVGLATDLTAPTPLDSVHLQIVRLPGMDLLGDQDFPISGNPDKVYGLPGTYAVYSDSGTPDRVRILLTATDHLGTVIVQRSAVLNLVPEKTLFVRLGVVSACMGKLDCPEANTCIEGRCAPEQIDSSRLPVYTEGMENEVSCSGAVSFVDTSTKQPLVATGTVCPAQGVCQDGLCLTAVTSFSATASAPIVARGAAFQIGSDPVTLDDGSVLLAGGVGANGAPVLSSAELYDPLTQKFTATGSLTTARTYYGEAKLPDGRVLIAGGINEGQAALSTAELYDPATKRFTATKTPMTVARTFPTLLTLADGRILVVGGMNDIQSYTSGTVSYHGSIASAELYDPATDTFTATPGSLTEGRAFPHVSGLPDGGALVIGGASGGVSRVSLERFVTATGTFVAAQPATLPTGATGCGSDLAELHDGRLLITMSPLDDVWLLDPAKGLFTSVGYHPTTPPAQFAAVLADGRALFAGAGAGQRAYVFDPYTSTFAFVAGQMTVSRPSLAGAALADGNALIVGAGVASAEIFHADAPMAASTAATTSALR